MRAIGRCRLAVEKGGVVSWDEVTKRPLKSSLAPRLGRLYARERFRRQSSGDETVFNFRGNHGEKTQRETSE